MTFILVTQYIKEKVKIDSEHCYNFKKIYKIREKIQNKSLVNFVKNLKFFFVKTKQNIMQNLAKMAD